MAAAAASVPTALTLAEGAKAKSVNKTSTAIAAYYLRAQMYTCVPRQIREDMEWMAAIGTNYVCVGVLEQDLFAAYENHALIATDAELTKSQAKRLAIMANDGMARAIYPAHAPMDGDTIFAAATGQVPLGSDTDLLELGHVATQVMARAIARGVYEAEALPYPGARPGWKARFAT